MGCVGSKAGSGPTSPASSSGPGDVNAQGKSNGRRKTRDRSRKRGRRRGRSAASLGSPRFTQLSISSDTIYFDAHDELSSEEGPSRLAVRGSYQDDIDDYPSSGTRSPPHRVWSKEEKAAVAQAAADADALLQQEEAPTCLPRVFQNRERDSSKTFVRLTRPRAGSSMRRGNSISANAAALAAETVPEYSAVNSSPFSGASLQTSPSGRAPCVETWEDPGGGTFLVRGPDYPKTKKKVLSQGAIYRLLAVDVYSFDFRLAHIAKHVQLPQPPVLGDQSHLPPKQRLPPLLIINVQLPDYPASLWGKTDGQGASLVYYFALPDGWTPDQEPNQAALGLLQRFVHGEQEADGSPTRDRLKLIARVANVDEWAVEAPLSGTEQALLRRYNDKPLMTRPQQRFFLTRDYLEVDLDVHNYAYLARKAFTGFSNRLSTVVFENAFVIQGNKQEELPEKVMAAARVSYVDFQRIRPFPADTMEHVSSALHEDGSSVDSFSGNEN